MKGSVGQAAYYSSTENRHIFVLGNNYGISFVRRRFLLNEVQSRHYNGPNAMPLYYSRITA